MSKKSFILHIDSLSILDDLTDEQAGQLFKAIKSYQKGEDADLNQLIKIAFSPFKNQFIRDEEGYEKTVERNRINGLKGGRPKKQEEPKETQKTHSVISKPKKADSDSDSKNDSDSKSKKENNRTGILDFSDWPSMPTDQLMEDWRTMRKNKKLPMTQTVVNGYARELKKATEAGYTVEQCLTECVVRGWQGFKVEWLSGDRRQGPQQNQQKQLKPL